MILARTDSRPMDWFTALGLCLLALPACSVSLPLSAGTPKEGYEASAHLAPLVDPKHAWGADDCRRLCEAARGDSQLVDDVLSAFKSATEVRVSDAVARYAAGDRALAREVRSRCLLIFETCGQHFRSALPLTMDLLEAHILRGEYAGPGPRIDRALAALAAERPAALGAEARLADDPVIRMRYARILGRVRRAPDQAAVELKSLLSDPDPEVAVHALESLGRLDRVDTGLLERVQQLIPTAKDDMVRDMLRAIHKSWSERLAQEPGKSGR